MRTIWGLIAALLFASICQGQINPPPGAPNTIRVQFIIRDFVGQYPNGVPAGANRTTHPDFQRVNARDSGIVNRVLGGDRVRFLSEFHAQSLLPLHAEARIQHNFSIDRQHVD